MYIRRKVFSVAYDENGEERLFSTTEFMSEEEYIEKLYAESEKEEKKSNKAAKIAGASAAGVAGLGGGAVVGGKLISNKMMKKLAKDLQEQEGISKQINNLADSVPEGYLQNLREKLIDKSTQNRLKKEKADKFAKPYDVVAREVKKGVKWARRHPIAAASIGVGGTALGVGGAYAAKKLKKNKKD